ncbi:MAG: hypothetical protein AUK55_04770 [Syntrophobacteraceae bacterium CG2_30_61_12]|nr:MAG: hypothetical protein AUK55_04770 [Syntrophobacteraceae bacterium CG2_30_61_12]
MEGGETVLVVEDESLILALTQSILEHHGYQVHAFDNPTAALAWAESFTGEIDLLITDVVMPEMNGRELQQRIEARHPAARCLFMSGYTADIMALRGVESGGIHFIHKPFSVASLVRKVRDILD